MNYTTKTSTFCVTYEDIKVDVSDSLTPFRGVTITMSDAEYMTVAEIVRFAEYLASDSVDPLFIQEDECDELPQYSFNTFLSLTEDYNKAIVSTC